MRKNTRADAFAKNIVQALTSGEQHFKPGILLTDTDIHVENFDSVNHKQLKKGLSRLTEKDALSCGCACELKEHLLKVNPNMFSKFDFFTK